MKINSVQTWLKAEGYILICKASLVIRNLGIKSSLAVLNPNLIPNDYYIRLGAVSSVIFVQEASSLGNLVR